MIDWRATVNALDPPPHWLLPPIQRMDYPAPMSLIEIARLRAQSRRHWWNRLPQLWWAW